MNLIYPDLRRIARAHLRREPRERILQPTALVNEAYLRLVAHREHTWQNRAHFFGAAAQVMRRILIERARARLAEKRNGSAVPLEAALELSNERSVELVAIDHALVELAAISPRQAQVVEMRYFGGLTIEETAEAMGLTPRTVNRDWAIARAWLRRYLKQ
jgi:RNA polymerase sigma-70 factor, ECF subfamily